MMKILRWLQHQNQEEGIAQELGNAAYENDPIGALLVKKWRLKPAGFLMIGILGAACLQGSSLLLYAIIPTLSAQSLFNYMSLWSELIIYWVAFPATLAFYPWFILSHGRLFSSLYTEVIAANAKQKARELLLTGQYSVRSRISDKRWAYLTLGIVIASTTWWVFSGVRGDWIINHGIYHYDLRLYMYLQIPFRVVGGYMLFISLARVIVVVHSLYRFFNRKELSNNDNGIVRLRPLHIDKYGGLGMLNYYAFRLSFFFSVVGLWIILNLYASISINQPTILDSLVNDSGLWLGTLAYIVIMPVLFFLTLYPAKRELQHSKTAQLRKISEQIDDKLQSKLIELNPQNGILPDFSNGRLGKLYTIYELVKKNPTWAFEFSTISKLLITYMYPIVSFLLPLLLMRLTL